MRVVAVGVLVAMLVSACGRPTFVIGEGRNSRPDLEATCGQIELFEVDEANSCLAFWGIAYACHEGLGSPASDCQVDANGVTRWVGFTVSSLEWERIGWSACDEATREQVVSLNFCPAP